MAAAASEILPTTPTSTAMVQRKCSHSERLGNLLETGFRSDLTLVLGKDKQEIKVHRIFLQHGSKVLDSEIEKCGGDISNRLELEDVEDVKSFKMMIKYFYTGTTGATITEGLPLLKMATQFDVPELRDECATLLQGTITEDNALTLFEEGMKFAHKELIASTLKFICRQARRILKLPKFCDLRLECLIEIIQQDGLQARNETEVFEAVYRWAEAECKRQNLDPSNNEIMRKIIDKPLNYVRLPLMDKEDFALYVASKKLLSSDEAMDVVLCFLVSQEKRSLLPHGRFISTPRKYFAVEGDWQISRRGPFTAATPLKLEKAQFVAETLCFTLGGQDSSLNLKEIVFPKELFGANNGTDSSGNVTWLGSCRHHHYFRTPCKVEMKFTSGSDNTLKEASEFVQRKVDGSYWIPFIVKLVPNVRYKMIINFVGASYCCGRSNETHCLVSGLKNILQQVTNFDQFPVILDKDGGFLLSSSGLDVKVRLERENQDNSMPLTSGFIRHLVFDVED